MAGAPSIARTKRMIAAIGARRADCKARGERKGFAARTGRMARQVVSHDIVCQVGTKFVLPRHTGISLRNVSRKRWPSHR